MTEIEGLSNSIPWRSIAALSFLVLMAAGPFIYPLRPQQASRYALTRAVAEKSTVIVDDYAHLLDKDLAIKDGHTYSDKAPGQPLFAVPFLIVGRALGFDPADVAREERSLDLWWVTLWSATVFGAGLLIAMHIHVREAVGEFALAAPMALFFGSMLLPFSALLFGHVMAGFFLYVSFLVVKRASKGGNILVAGALAGAALVVEYTAAIGVAILTGFVVARKVRMFGWWAGGGALLAIPLAIYNYLAFGSPFRFSYQFTAFEGVVDSARPLLHMFSAATLDDVIELFFSGRGIVVATPIVVCAVIAAFTRIKTRDLDAIIGLLIFGAFLLVPILWENPWGGSAPGPRYLTPALPFLAVPLAWSWRQWPMITRLAVAVSVLTMASALVVQAMPFAGHPAGLGAWLSLLGMGRTTDTLWTVLMGSWGWLFHAILVLLAVGWVWMGHGQPLSVASESATASARRGRLPLGSADGPELTTEAVELPAGGSGI